MCERPRKAAAAINGADNARRAEAERLIDLAKGMLTQPAEEIAAIYLDHALDALQAIPVEDSSRLTESPR